MAIELHQLGTTPHNRQHEEASAGWRRLTLFYSLAVGISGACAFTAAEIMVRSFVPKEFFWPISNIYQQSPIPGLVYTLKPNLDAMAFGVDLKTNSLGFRGPDWPEAKPDDVFRLILVGDSHAFGYGVSFENTVGEVLASILEQRLDMPTEVLNFGTNGYNGDQQRAVLEHVALHYAPDVVLLMPANNDHEPARRADKDGWLHWDAKEDNPGSRIIDTSGEDTKADDVSWWIRNSRLLLYPRLLRKRRQLQDESQRQRDLPPGGKAAIDWMSAFPAGPVSERLAETVYRPLEQMLTLTADHGTPVIIASYAAWVEYRQMFQILERDHGVPVLELLLLFPEARTWEELIAQFGLGWDTHLNAVAHRRWAEGIADLIIARGYYPSPDPRAGVGFNR